MDSSASIENEEQGSSSEDVESSELEALRTEREELLATLQRVQAEFENFRKRVMRDQAQQLERAHAALVEQLLPVLDSFELALLSIPSGALSEAAEKLKRGVELVYAEFLAVLEKAGLERIDALGRPFDPEGHEAVLRDEGEGQPLVTEVMRTGYRLKGRMLRPAMVRVGPPGPERPISGAPTGTSGSGGVGRAEKHGG